MSIDTTHVNIQSPLENADIDLKIQHRRRW